MPDHGHYGYNAVPEDLLSDIAVIETSPPNSQQHEGILVSFLDPVDVAPSDGTARCENKLQHRPAQASGLEESKACVSG